MRANNGDHLHRYAGSSGGGGREGEAYIVGGVGSGSDSSPWISCSAVRTISLESGGGVRGERERVGEGRLKMVMRRASAGAGGRGERARERGRGERARERERVGEGRLKMQYFEFLQHQELKLYNLAAELKA